jgi:hypothetical protein
MSLKGEAFLGDSRGEIGVKYLDLLTGNEVNVYPKGYLLVTEIGFIADFTKYT